MPPYRVGMAKASMGPLVYTSGNACGAVGRAGDHPLQWGRWFTPAETRDARPLLDAVVAASMGPLVYTSGNRTVGRCWGPGRCASMGPLVYTSGNLAEPAMARAAGFASMGPLVYTSGNMEHPEGWIGSIELQWGRWFTPAETHPSRRIPGEDRRFNGAAGLHQRKRGWRRPVASLA